MFFKCYYSEDLPADFFSKASLKPKIFFIALVQQRHSC